MKFRRCSQTKLQALCALLLASGCSGAKSHSRIAPEGWRPPTCAEDSVAPTTTKTYTAIDSANPAGEVTGLVARAYDDEPIRDVRVEQVGVPARGEMAAVTDITGRFHLTHVPPSLVVLRARAVGFRAETLTVDGRRGALAKFAMHWACTP
jgi:hypothetical protein